MRRLAALIPISLASLAAASIPSPKEFFGHDVCEDYWLANYRQLTAYWQELDAKSDRITVESIGRTEDGRDQLMCVITDPANRRNLANYRKASERLARAKDFKDDADARNFARKQKAVIWIDGGLHATEVLATQQLIETAYRLVSAEDDETKRIRRDCIILLTHANPDGMDWVSDWYMRKKEPAQRSLAGLPYLYQKYCGHDNNRDFYANNMAETRNINRILYSVWYPQIVYNHHQSAPAGTIMFVPPFRNPFNYHFDPMIDIATDLVGTHMHQRMIAEGKPGTAMRGSTLYSTWWNGGLRTTTYFHNMVGILTETYGSPSPGPLPFVQRFQIPTTDVPFPVEAGKMWHLRDSLEYEISANYAILEYASRYRERVLFDTYRAARNSIERGSRDSWSRYPSRIAAFGADALKIPELRDARMYVIPADQPDFPTACMFVEKLMQCGVEVERLTEEASRPSSLGEEGLGGRVDSFSSEPLLNGEAAHPPHPALSSPGEERVQSGKWPAGSFVIRCDQAFRPHILDMFEPQDHPNDFQYPGGPPIPPYDNAGYTLAYQMGVKFDRVLDPVELRTTPYVNFEWLYSRSTMPVSLGIPWTRNDSFTYANRGLKVGLTVSRTSSGVLIAGDSSKLERLRSEIQPRPSDGSFVPAGFSESPATPLPRPRVALWDRYGGSMESGWTRYVLEQFAFDFDVVYPPDLDYGDLNAKYDCIILPSGAIPGGGAGRGGAPAGGNTGPGGEAGGSPETDFHEGGGWFVPPAQVGQGQQNLADDPTIPYIYRRRIGSVTAKTLAELRKFVENGGHLLCIGSSALNIARQFKLPVESALVDEKGAVLPNTKFYIPGSVLRMKLNPGPLTLGMEGYVDAMFDNSPAFRVGDARPLDEKRPSPPDGVAAPGVGVLVGGASIVGFYDSDKPLRSGWAWGQELLKDTASVVDVPLGKGQVVLYGPEILFRAQSHGTFKLLFNAIFRSAEAR